MLKFLMVFLLISTRSLGAGVGTVDDGNSSDTPLAGGATYTGEWQNVSAFPSVMTAVVTDVAGTLYMEFNTDCTGAVQASLSYGVVANIEEVHRLSVTRPCYRTRYVNGSAAQASFNLVTMLGYMPPLSAPANLTMGQDSDATVTRIIDAETDIAEGKRSGYKLVHKFGRNPDLDSGTVPEDVWALGGPYTGFPLGSAELLEILSSDVNDTSAGSGAKTVQIFGLDANGDEQDEVIILSGVTGVDSVNTYTRLNRAIVLTSGSNNQAFNVGNITVRHKTTTANIFARLPAGFNQTQIGCYTIPSGKTGYLRKLHANIKRSASATMDGSIWCRESGGSPRLIRIFSASQADGVDDTIYGGLEFPALTDLCVRITAASTTNMEVTGSFDLIIVDN